MNQTAAPFAESEIPLFDVFVRAPEDTSLQNIERLVQAVPGQSSANRERLIKALRNGPQVKIGGGVSQERADRARAQFSKAGLVVVISPVLVLQSMMTGAFDGLFVCPACNGRVLLPQNRQCPDCGVFVDKVTEEFLLKRKIMEQERAKLTYQADRDTKESLKLSRQAMEAAIRAQVRKELEAEMGHRSEGIFSGRVGLMRATGIAGLLALAFAGGNAMPQSGLPWGKADNTVKGSAPADVDTMLDQIASRTANTSMGPPAEGSPDIEDLLTQPGASRTGKGISLEQALAAANTLGKAVGNTTAERAWAGSAAPTKGGNPAIGTQVGGSQATAPATALAKWLLTAEFARQLAELGQWQRAQDVVKALKAMPRLALDPVAAAAVRLADLEVQAWAIGPLGEGRARNAADALKSAAVALEDPAERAQALGRAGVILSHHAQLPPAASQAFLTLAAQALKSVTKVQQRAVAVDDWMVSMGEVLSAEVAMHAKSGLWSKAKTASAQLEGLVKQATTASARARLYAIDFRIRQQLGQADRSAQSLEMALSTGGLDASLPARAAMLRAIAHLSGAAALEPVQTAVNAFLVQLESQTGMVKAQALTQLALLQADAGLRAKADQYARMARDTPGVSASDAVTLNADLIVRGELAAARLLHGQGRYAESEVLLKGLADYMF